jgi:hypothetical protein
MNVCVYDNPETMRRECWNNGELQWFITAEMLLLKEDFISKMETVVEEADETLFWLEMIDESEILNEKEAIIYITKETNELLSIFIASVKTVKNRLNSNKKT